MAEQRNIPADLVEIGTLARPHGIRGEIRVNYYADSLELLRGEGLVGALALLGLGPTPAYPDAVAVVRETLLPRAHELLDGPWKGDVREIAPGASLELSSS